MLRRGLAQAAARRLEHAAGELEIGMRRLRRHVMLQAGLVIEPFGEGVVRRAREIERARTEEEHWRLRVSETDLRSPKRLRKALAGAVGAAVVLRDGATVEAFEGVGAEELQVLLALAHAAEFDAADGRNLRPRCRGDDFPRMVIDAPARAGDHRDRASAASQT